MNDGPNQHPTLGREKCVTPGMDRAHCMQKINLLGEQYSAWIQSFWKHLENLHLQLQGTSTF